MLSLQLKSTEDSTNQIYNKYFKLFKGLRSSKSTQDKAHVLFLHWLLIDFYNPSIY